MLCLALCGVLGLYMQLVEPRFSARLAGLGPLPLPQLVRAGTEQLMRLSQLEGQLLEQLFGSSAGVIARPQQLGGTGGAPAPGQSLVASLSFQLLL